MGRFGVVLRLLSEGDTNGACYCPRAALKLVEIRPGWSIFLVSMGFFCSVPRWPEMACSPTRQGHP